ncbi:MAG: peptidase S8/S53 subtilisin kexin sedolisin [Candidatus Peregrinibacteria bacterium Greene0416_19]|nr:MAG: peptidase S8/S53 subtilisin kexin sedolisin [Candidatus Peregrinibacteria bacterium Greene0416_19]
MHLLSAQALSTATRALLVATLFLCFGVAEVSLQAATGAGFASVHPATEPSRIPRCDELHLCESGQRRLLIPRNDEVIAELTRQGCKVVHLLREQAVIRCPAGVMPKGAREERLLHLTDAASGVSVAAAAALLFQTSGKGVRVAILDAGMQADHQEIAGRVVAEANFVSGAAAGISGHGTHVAGIIAGQGVRRIPDQKKVNRVMGISQQAELISATVCTPQGWCPEGDVISGMEWAVSQGARVINVSLGVGRSTETCDQDPLAKEVNWAADRGVVVVVAAGNSGGNGEGIASPACASKVIAVGAVDGSNARPDWSAFGKPLSLVAPGVRILSSIACDDCPPQWYAWWSGTSMAAPHVSAAAALLLSLDPTLTSAEVRSILARSAKDLGPRGRDAEYGYGLLDIERALRLTMNKDGDSHDFRTDCNDRAVSAWPGAPELCNGIDDSCDGRVDEGCPVSVSVGALRRGRRLGTVGQAETDPRPACTAQAWSCAPFGECKDAIQIYSCALANSGCRNAEAVRPPAVRACSP